MLFMLEVAVTTFGSTDNKGSGVFSGESENMVESKPPTKPSPRPMAASSSESSAIMTSTSTSTSNSLNNFELQLVAAEANEVADNGNLLKVDFLREEKEPLLLFCFAPAGGGVVVLPVENKMLLFLPHFGEVLIVSVKVEIEESCSCCFFILMLLALLPAVPFSIIFLDAKVEFVASFFSVANKEESIEVGALLASISSSHVVGRTPGKNGGPYKTGSQP
mmetsp:Transcript_29944/g.34455  ORF Transcript_29944/g.34455 Transcript_29944/m.34455 type:complete len:220 (+) Transcript_29944:307-966(+)